MSILHALILALVEGLTEFLPVSSTAHLLFTEELLGIEQTEYVKMFTVSIQFGAILAVVVAYWKRFFINIQWSFYRVLAIAVIPALILGKLFDDKIEAVFEKPLVIALVLILGGIVLLFIDRIFSNQAHIKDQEVSVRKGIFIGLWQCLAMMPGVSRSAASIIGGMQQGLNRKSAAEFSFFLAVPTMAAVTLYSVFLKNWCVDGQELKGISMILSSTENTLVFFIGNIASFIIAFVAIKSFITFLQKYGFKVWGIYRIAVGLILLILFINQEQTSTHQQKKPLCEVQGTIK
ncbi:MAG: undecaprenyl-diphosphate phosphatase [Crocinitomicaceae bacterium]|jgi:undecaprenyl-diphosphatase|nr:undecaprenyl-diphosphate phosphatase [Crocinitomicaceae bacterium]